MRLALRDASRHRGRTGPAVAAVLAAVAGSIAVSAWITSQVAADRASYHPMLRLGQTGVQVYPDSSHPAPDPATIQSVLTKDLPVTGLTAMSTTQCFDARKCMSVFIKPPPTTCQDGSNATCAQDLGSGGVAIGDGKVLDALLGHHDTAATSALERGDVVVFSPGFADNGKSTLVLERLNSATGHTHSRSVASYVADVGKDGVAVNGIMSASTAAGMHITGQPWGYLLTTSRTPTQAEEDAARADLSQWSTSLLVERGYHPERWNYGLLALAGAAALVTLGATAIATALSAADSRPDLVTLAAVGAAPRLRRRFAAGQAATVAVLGTVLGALAGLIPAWAVLHAHGHMPWATPWQSIGIVVVAVPIVAATATALLTRSRLPSERRVA
jgi:putative ABC transport system permease protein